MHFEMMWTQIFAPTSNSPLVHSHTVDCDCVGVQMLGAEEHQADPAEVKQLHLIII